MIFTIDLTGLTFSAGCDRYTRFAPETHGAVLRSAKELSETLIGMRGAGVKGNDISQGTI